MSIVADIKVAYRDGNGEIKFEGAIGWDIEAGCFTIRTTNGRVYFPLDVIQAVLVIEREVT